jgi:hypothetical protein
VRQIILPILVFLCILQTAVQAQPKNFLTPPPAPDKAIYQTLVSAETRALISLNGQWELSSDEGDSWLRVQVPSCYNDEENLVYRRSFQLPPEMLKKYRWKVVCNGIQYQSTISINGQIVGQHESGMPFSLLVPEEVKLQANNTIRVDVSNQLDYTSTVPRRKLLLGNRTYGGIIRDIFLVGVPRVWIDDVRFETLLKGTAAEAKVRVRVTSASIKGMTVSASGDSVTTMQEISEERADLTLRVLLRSPSGVDTIEPGDVAQAETPFTIDSKRTANLDVLVPVAAPTLWRPGSPYLYDMVVQVLYKGALVDEEQMKLGFRTLTTKGEQILLNGEPIVLKGVVYLEDSEKYGSSLPYDLMRRDLQAIKDMGANMIRFADGVPHPYLLKLCDEFGLMAWVDASIGTPPASLFDDEGYVRRSLDRIRYMIEEGGSYTCVTAYGLSAPIPGGNKAALDAVRRMRQLVDSLDYRPFYCSSIAWGDPGLRNLVDIAGITTFDIEAAKLRSTIKRVRSELGGSKPLVILSYGKFVQLENHNGYSDPISVEAQAKYVSDIYNVLQEQPIGGGIYWAFNDYRTDRPILTVNNEKQYLATCGLFGLDRELRQGAAMLGALYTSQKTPDVLIGDYSPPSTFLFIAVGIICAFLFLLLINSSRRFRENVSRALLRPYNFFADIRDQRILSNLQTTLLGLVISATFAMIVASLCYYYRMDEGFDAIMSTAVSSDGIMEFLNFIIWRPWLSVISFTVLFFLLLLGVAALIRLCAVFVRNRIFFSDAYSIAIWAGLPVVILIPVGMILYRVLEAPSGGFAILMLIIIFILWLLYRVLRGTSVVYDVRPLNVYGYALLSIAAVVALMFVTSGATHATLSYLREGIGVLYNGG